MKFARIIPALASLSLLLAACEGTPTSAGIAPPAVPRREEDPPPPPAPADSTDLGGGTKGGGG